MFTNERATKCGKFLAWSPTCSRPGVSQYDRPGKASFTIVQASADEPAEGATKVVSVSVPSGLAASVPGAAIAPGTSTACPLEAARANACSVLSGPAARAGRAPAATAAKATGTGAHTSATSAAAAAHPPP